MRNPIWVKREELMNARDGRPGPAAGVFTQDADQWFSSGLREPVVSDLPDPMRSLAKPIINALSIAGTRLEPEQMPDSGGREAASSWARNWEQTPASPIFRITKWLGVLAFVRARVA